MTKYIDGVRAALEEMAQIEEKKKIKKIPENDYENDDDDNDDDDDEEENGKKKKNGKKDDMDEEGNVKEAAMHEGRMKELHGYIDKGMSAKDIAKKMRLDVKTIQALMPSKKEAVEEKMDPVNPKAVKKDFKDRKDKDIDNDGDVDDSDEYLHKKRKAISKSKGKNEDEPEGEKGETAKMNPKKEDKVTKESTVRERLMSIWEDAAGAKRMKDQNREPMPKDDERSAKKMKDGHPADRKGEIGKEADDSSAAEKSTKPAAKRGNDNKMGDVQIINKIANAYKTLGKGKDA